MASLWSYLTGSSTSAKPLNPESLSNNIDEPRSASTSTSTSGSSGSSPLHQAGPNKFVTEKNPTGIKPCCACPDTKRERDDCLLAHGPEAKDGACKELMLRHSKCMQALGFNV